jgi:hypothetical protein
VKRFRTKKVMTVVLAGAIVLGGAGAALAYFTSSGSGTGTTSVGIAASNLSITDNSSSLTPLLPGSPAQDVTVTVTNESTTQSAYVNGLTAYVTVTEDPTYASLNSYVCSSADFLLDGVAGSTSGTPVTIAGWTAQDLASNGGSASTVPTDNTIQFNDLANTNQDTCQDATVTINYSSN